MDCEQQVVPKELEATIRVTDRQIHHQSPARQIVAAWCQDFDNSRRRHSSAALMSPFRYECQRQPKTDQLSARWVLVIVATVDGLVRLAAR